MAMEAAAAALQPSRRGGTGEGGTGGGFEGCARRKHKRRLAVFYAGREKQFYVRCMLYGTPWRCCYPAAVALVRCVQHAVLMLYQLWCCAIEVVMDQGIDSCIEVDGMGGGDLLLLDVLPCAFEGDGPGPP